MSDILDPRNIRTGWEIPTETYSDQPYVVRTQDGAWLCVVTTGAGREGESGQHVVTRRSTDRGRTWSDAVTLEPPAAPSAVGHPVAVQKALGSDADVRTARGGPAGQTLEDRPVRLRVAHCRNTVDKGGPYGFRGLSGPAHGGLLLGISPGI